MPSFPDESISDALERSLRNSKELKAVNSVTIATARHLAKRLDLLFENDFITDSGKFDNVTVPTFLKYLSALGLTITAEESSKKTVKAVKPTAKLSPRDDLTAFRMKHSA